ncbi:lipopolysaccharide biosynthesis protein [Enterococcus xiangfangensis]|uniref:Oligosaccharide flippase family protein n=1 Tax=Enterococcus xiangfangensis TaxID=1296537 RepID=A0ABU3F7L7_9ENTE|nr:oligosaccharide flippase family protein [Enterococcus xiangfangensis]MDT2758652.1 oligosaccharide flippase family protein [Enterococcus xiangfangensis]
MNKSSERKFAVVLSYTNIILKNLVVFLYTPFLLNYLGQAEYGIYQMTNSVIMGLSILSMGFSGSYVRFFMRYKTRKDEEGIRSLNGMYLLLFIGIAILSLFIGMVFVMNTKRIFGSAFTEEEVRITKTLMGILVFNIALTFPSSVFDCNILAQEHLKFQQSRQIAQTVLTPLVSIPLVLFGMGAVAVVGAQTITTLILMIINIKYAITQLGMRFNFRNIPLGLLKEVSIFSFFIFLSQVIDLANNNIPSFIVGAFLGAKDVAIYSVASQVKNLFFMLSVGLSGVFVPHINEMVSRKVSKEKLLSLMIKVGRIQFILLTFILGGFISVGEFFIQIWAGEANMEAYYLVIIMILPVLIPLSQNVGIEIQRAMNRHYFRSIIYFIFAAINVAVTILAVMKYGVMGSTFGYVISMICANGIAMNWYYQKKMGLDVMKFWKSLINILIPFVLSTGSILLIENFITRINFPIFCILGVLYSVIYFLLYYFTAASNLELEHFSRIIKRTKR